MVILGVLLVLLVVRALRRRGRRKLSADALSDALGTIKPYTGPTWRVGDRWL